MRRVNWGRAVRWVPLVVVGAEALLVLGGVVDLAEAAAVLLLVEMALAGLVVGAAAALRAGYRRARRAGAGRGDAISVALDAALPPVVARLLRYEIQVWVALYRRLRRRPNIAPGATAFGYGGAMRFPLVGLTVVSMVEVVAVELIVPWPPVRWLLVLLGGYGMVWLLGFVASMWVNPHTVGPAELRLRFGFFADLAVPTALLRSARRELTGSHRETVEYEDGTLSVSVLGVTDVCVELTEPYPVDLGRAGVRPVHRVRLHADDPRAAVRALCEAITVRPDLA